MERRRLDHRLTEKQYQELKALAALRGLTLTDHVTAVLEADLKAAQVKAATA